MVDSQSATTEIMRGKKRRKKERNRTTLECGPMPNVMATLLNIGGTSVQRRKLWLMPTTASGSNAAKTRNPLKFAGVPQTRQQISAVSGPKFTIL